MRIRITFVKKFANDDVIDIGCTNGKWNRWWWMGWGNNGACDKTFEYNVLFEGENRREIKEIKRDK